jgi:glycosyltransferase A (GT-A) superfamily protein (DUF2064 family)
MNAALLIVAKAPVPGLAKTRIAATVGPEAAADLAAAALLDTLDVARSCDANVVVAITGDLDSAARSHEISDALADLTVIDQRGDGLAERLANAHADAAGHGPVVQIGMDTPQVTADDLSAADALVQSDGAVLGPAADGGWWLLGLDDATRAAFLVDVPMSAPDTGARTTAALGAGHPRLRELRDMDTWPDVVAIAAEVPDRRIAESARRWA